MPAVRFVSLSCCLLAAIGCSATAQQASNGAVGTILVFVDDLRPEMSPYGINNTLTPNFDRLASWGRHFRRAYTQIAICSPSRWTVFSGLRPDTSKLWYIGPYLRDTFAEGPNVTTLSQAFKEAKGVTLVKGAGKTLHPGTSSGGPDSSTGGGDAPYSWLYDEQSTTHGYFWCDQFYNGTLQSPKSVSWPGGTGCEQSQACIDCLRQHDSLGGPTFKPSWRAAPCDASCYPDGAVADEAQVLIKEAAETAAKAGPSSHSFFLGLGLKRPHLGYFMPSKYLDMYPSNASIDLAPNRYPPKDMPRIAFYGNGEMIGMQDVGKALVNDSSGYPLIVDWKQRELRRAYRASVTFMDSQLGRILDAVEANGLRGKVNLALVGDHGYSLAEHGEWCKQQNFENAVRVPLFFAGPGIEPGTVDSQSVVEMLNIAPTLAELAGINVTFKTEGTRWQGRSMAKLLLEPPPVNAPPPVFTAALSQFPRHFPQDFASDAEALRNDRATRAYLAGIGALPNARFEGDLVGYGTVPEGEDEEAEERAVLSLLAAHNVGNTMGLSLRTTLYRYTEWRPFNFTTATVNWVYSHGTELYSHDGDDGYGEAAFQDFENVNLANDPQYAEIVQDLHEILQYLWNRQTASGSAV